MKRLILLAVVVAGCGKGAETQAPIAWEYDVVFTEDAPNRLYFNGHGDHGWELIQVVPSKIESKYYIYKRPKQ